MLVDTIRDHHEDFGMVLPIDYRSERALVLDLTDRAPGIDAVDLGDPEQFGAYIQSQLKDSGAAFGVGQYAEDRCIYDATLLHLSGGAGRRTLHLGVDLWVTEGMEVLSPLQGKIHSFANDRAVGGYGPTLILEHELDDLTFFTLYGHLGLDSLQGKADRQVVKKGEIIGSIGAPPINGNWPPHLHFQIIADMGDWRGDYPGVAVPSDMERYRELCPDPDLILQIPSVHSRSNVR